MEEKLKESPVSLELILRLVEKLHARIEYLENMIVEGFKATGTAWKQTKIVVQKLADETRNTKERLEEYGGVIEADSFF